MPYSSCFWWGKMGVYYRTFWMNRGKTEKTSAFSGLTATSSGWVSFEIGTPCASKTPLKTNMTMEHTTFFKMYLVLEIVIFHWHASLLEGNGFWWGQHLYGEIPTCLLSTEIGWLRLTVKVGASKNQCPYLKHESKIENHQVLPSDLLIAQMEVT